MSSSRSNRTTRRATRQLVELSAFVTTESDLSMLIDRAAQLVRRSLCADGCRIFRQSTDAGRLDVIAGEGDELGGADAALRALAHNALDAYVPSTGASQLHLSDAARRRTHSAAVPTERCRISGVSVVIEGESAPFGALAVYSITPRVFSRADIEFARLVGSILTGALRRIHHLRDRARLTTVVTCANEAIVELTAEGRIFNWNRAAESMFGYSADQAVGAPLSMLFAPGHSEEALAMLDYVCRGAVAGPFEKRLQRGDGTQIDAEVLLAPVVVPGGRISAASMIAHDIGHKRVTDRALLMHADILGHMPAGVFVWRLDDFKESSSLRLVLANRAAHEVAGSSLEDRIGRRFADVPLGFEESPNPELYATVVRTGTAHDFGEGWVACSDGSRRLYHVQAFPLPDQCVGVVFHDVTERQELAEQLRHAQRMEVIGRLTGCIAHDFNNLLTVISGHAELLRNEVDTDAPIAENLREIERASKSAEQLTRQLLAFGRRQVMRPVTFDLAVLVRESRSMLKRLIGEDIQLAVISDGSVTIRADAGQLEQVLLNLVVNARDAMPAGGRIMIESSLAHVTDPIPGCDAEVPAGTYGVLQVTDTGLGMEPQVLARAFEPFFTTKEPGKGTGLGLSTVYGIVKQSGGHIIATSELGVGTTFKVYLPITEQLEADTKGGETSVAPIADGSKTVLLVEDDLAVRSLVRRIVTRAGFTVLEAETSEEALRLAGRFAGSIDLLITDVVMPQQSGPELALRLMISFPGIRVLYMSGYVLDSPVGRRALPKDALLIQKPFSAGSLLSAIARALAPGKNPVSSRAAETVM